MRQSTTLLAIIMKPLLFLKFNEERYIASLHKTGDIFMRPNSEFRKADNNKERFDKFEGAISNEYIQEGTLEIKADGWCDWKKLKIFNSNLNSFSSTSAIYSYSLYVLTLADLQSNDIYKVDGRMSEFGSHFLMIRKPIDFLSRISSYFEKNQYEYCFDFVSYYNLKENHKQLTLFHKPDTLSHQKEFRLIVKAKSHRPLQFEIGSLESYSEIYESKILNHLLMKL